MTGLWESAVALARRDAARVMAGDRPTDAEVTRAVDAASREAAKRERELSDELVAMVAETLGHVREQHYGGVHITPEQINERARAVVSVLLVHYKIERR